MKEERVKASKLLAGPEAKPAAENKEELIEAVRKALFMSKICSYAQGFAQMKAASEEYGWDLKYGDIAMIFRGGCIIRAAFLQKSKKRMTAIQSLTTCFLTRTSKISLKAIREPSAKRFLLRLNKEFLYLASQALSLTLTATALPPCRPT